LINKDNMRQAVKDYKNDFRSALWDYGGMIEDALEHIEQLERALDIYKRERDRYAHATPEMTGQYFLAGGLGEEDKNLLPEYVEICPAYGCAWTQLYKRTEKTINMEGS